MRRREGREEKREERGERKEGKRRKKRKEFINITVTSPKKILCEFQGF
jgi:hypothetical protein